MKIALRYTVVVLLALGATVEAQRIEDGIVVFYDFREGDDEIVHDSGPGEPLDLMIDPFDLGVSVEWLPDRGLSMNLGSGPQGAGGALPIASAGPATKIYEAIAAPGGSSEYTLEVWVRPEIPDLQSNISRIVTMSENPSNRNFTFGTVTTGDQYVNRLRTFETGNNGSGGPGQLITSGRTVHAGQRQHVVFTRDEDGEEILYIDNAVRAGPRTVNDFDGVLSNWDPTYPLGVGNELTRDRKFNGVYHLVAIYNEVLSPEDVDQNFNAASVDGRTDGGLVALYLFNEGDGTEIADSGPGEPLDLEIDPFDLDTLVEWVPEGLAMNLGTGTGQGGGALVQSLGAATKIYDAVAGPDGTNAVSIEVWVTPELPDLLVNISRMVTMSIDPTHRNFTLGTTGDGKNFVNRLRTPETGDNGTGGPNQLIASAGPAVQAGELQHVVFTRTFEGEESIYVDNQLLANRLIAELDDLSGWDPSYRLGLGDEFIDGGRKFNGEYFLVAIYDWALSAEDVEQNFNAGLEADDAPRFVRGDTDSSGVINLADGIRILGFLFGGGSGPPTCMDAADVDDSGGALQITDAVAIFGWLFSSGTPPADPGPRPGVAAYAAADCGVDPTDDGLDCAMPAEVCQ